MKWLALDEMVRDVASRVSRRAARGGLPRVLSLARAVLPARDHVFVTATPSTEGNVVELVRSLLDRYPGRVVWAQAPTADYLEAVGLGDTDRILRVGKGRVTTLLRYASAEAVFFTHGIYGEPSINASKLTVNLWHGDGLKRFDRLFPQRRLRGKPSDVLVAQTRLWGDIRAGVCDMTPDDVVVTGNPRNDALFEPASAQALTSLGIDPEVPFVVWMPSYRSARSLGTMAAWSDSDDSDADTQLSQRLASGVRRLAQSGVQVVAKAHPFDAVARDVPGVVQVDDSMLEEQGVRLYSLLGASAGLISDVSSVWVDYLTLDRPIGFFWPDRAAYLRGRGVHPESLLSQLPGIDLSTDADFDAFALDVLAGGPATQILRDATRRAIGFTATRTAGHDLLDALAARPTTRFARRIRPRVPAAPVEAARVHAARLDAPTGVTDPMAVRR